MENIGLLMEYEDILLGKRKDFSAGYIGQGTSSQDISQILRYAFEKLLHWSPEDVRDYASPGLIRKLHLERIVNKIDFPSGLNPKTDMFYIACFLYPKQIRFSREKLAMQVYQKVIDGKLQKYPKNFFLSADGELNAQICLRYAINQNLYVNSVRELYEFVSDSDKALSWLKSINLQVPCRLIYEYPIDMLHSCLPASQKDELMYHMGKYHASLKKYKKEKANADKNKRKRNKT